MGFRSRVFTVAGCLAVVANGPSLAVYSYDFTFNDTHEIVRLASLEEGHFKHTFTNTGTQTDTYRMTISATEYHSGTENDFLWTMCNTNACVLPGVVQEMTLNPAQSETVTVKAVPLFVEGSARCTLTFSSVGSGQVTNRSYGMIVNGTDIVIIDDDGGANYQSFVATALAPLSGSYGIYETALQPLSDAGFDLNDSSWLIYLSGDQTTSTITAGDATFFGGFLNQGGRMVVSGQGLFNDISGGAFATTYLNASRTSTQAGQFNVQAIPASPLQSNQDFFINLGAGNQTQQDALTGSIPCFSYANGSIAGVCKDNGTYRTLSLGFGLEAVGQGAGDIGLTGVLTLIGNWFDSLLGLPDVVLGKPGPVTAVAAPNPMRASGVLRLFVPDGYAGSMTVALYDASGRRLSTLFDGTVTRSQTEVPLDALDAAGIRLPPGVYRYQVETDLGRTSGSVTLLR